LTLRWQPRGASAALLEADWGEHGHARLLRDPAQTQNYFHAAAIGMGRDASLPKQGLTVQARVARAEAGAWEDALGALFAQKPASKAGGRALLPSLDSVRVQAGQLDLWGLKLEQADVAARLESPGLWRADVASASTQGTLSWREGQGGAPGQVQGRFARLAVEAAQEQGGGPEWAADRKLELPGLQLQVDDFALDGRHLGGLTLRGVNAPGAGLWRLESLTLKSPSLSLSGQGQWTLAGPQRGLALTAKADVLDAGAYLKQAGIEDVLTGGKGTLELDMQWRGLPWRMDVNDVKGSLKLDLRDGRFSAVRSNAMKLLEVLSLQSLQRLLSLDFDPQGMFSAGFPFDSWSGLLRMDAGVIQTSDYRVEGPAGAISLAGTSRWTTEELDMQATVLPKLDVSGASLAAMALNPVVGLGAFLTQWVLKEPLSRAMAVHYEVKGTWRDPKLREVSVSQ
jgi:uncharacterized protein YhdP